VPDRVHIGRRRKLTEIEGLTPGAPLDAAVALQGNATEARQRSARMRCASRSVPLTHTAT
jgi:hypothetical protein